MVVEKKGQKSIIKQIKKKFKKKERLKCWFIPENEKEIIRQRSLDRYYKMKNKE